MQLFHYLTATLLSPFLTTNIMDSLDTPFTIEINGKPIARISDGEQTRTQAKVGPGSEAAVFKLHGGSLQCGGWMLGRNKTEDRSLLPKQVLWFKMDVDGEQALPIAFEKSGDSYKPKFNGACRAGCCKHVVVSVMLTRTQALTWSRRTALSLPISWTASTRRVPHVVKCRQLTLFAQNLRRSR
jgi:hypothetical protein